MIITHGGGFFSCCSVRLAEILRYINENHALPDKVEFSGTFDLDFYFKENQSLIEIVPWVNYSINNLWDAQHFQFNDNEFAHAKQFIQRYFTPSDNVQQAIFGLLEKYSIDLSRTCAVHFRGNDYRREAPAGSFEEYITKAKEIAANSPDIRFLITSDENEFTEAFLKEVPDSFSMSETLGMSRRDENYSFTLGPEERKLFISDFLAAVILISRCKIIITHSGNCGMWQQLFRGHNRNVYQFYIDRWI